jgi:serine/threonine protein kinase
VYGNRSAGVDASGSGSVYGNGTAQRSGRDGVFRSRRQSGAPLLGGDDDDEDGEESGPGVYGNRSGDAESSGNVYGNGAAQRRGRDGVFRKAQTEQGDDDDVGGVYGNRAGPSASVRYGSHAESDDADHMYGNGTVQRGREGVLRSQFADAIGEYMASGDDGDHMYGNAAEDGAAGGVYAVGQGARAGRDGVYRRGSGVASADDEHMYGNGDDAERADAVYSSGGRVGGAGGTLRIKHGPQTARVGEIKSEPADDYTQFVTDRKSATDLMHRSVRVRPRTRTSPKGGHVMTLFGATEDESTTNANMAVEQQLREQQRKEQQFSRKSGGAKGEDTVVYVKAVEKLVGFFYPREWLTFERELCDFEFGRVVQASTDNGGTSETVIVNVKIPRDNLSSKELEMFISEAKILARFSHKNVQRLVGVCAPQLPWLIVLEHCPYGDLRTFLRAAALTPGMDVTYAEQVYVCREVASGMAYLGSKMFVHRDLAARNCLVGDESAIKISGFELARSLEMGMDYYDAQDKGKLPVRWMSPESLLYQKFSVMSDVWSFGVLVWEVLTFGTMRPYRGIDAADLPYLVGEGQILPRPRNCTEELYSLLKQCWNLTPRMRPSFKELEEALNDMLERATNKCGEVRALGEAMSELNASAV